MNQIRFPWASLSTVTILLAVRTTTHMTIHKTSADCTSGFRRFSHRLVRGVSHILRFALNTQFETIQLQVMHLQATVRIWSNQAPEIANITPPLQRQWQRSSYCKALRESSNWGKPPIADHHHKVKLCIILRISLYMISELSNPRRFLCYLECGVA